MRFSTILLFFFTIPFLFAQTNDAFVYHSQLVDANGLSRANEKFSIGVMIQESLLQNRNVNYAEKYTIETDSIGWYSLKIGSGKVTTLNKRISDVIWDQGDIFLNVIVRDTLGNIVSRGISKIMNSPNIRFVKNIESRALLTLGCLTNLEALRNFPVPSDGEMICVKGHSEIRDGGEGFFYYKAEMLEDDDDGIIIKPKKIYFDKPGRWVRYLDGPINVNYYGATGKPGSDSTSDKIQRAIDFAANNKYNDWNKIHGRNHITKGNAVYFPNGNYIIDKALILKDGVTIRGEGYNTFLTAKSNSGLDYILKMEEGRVICHMEKFVLIGNSRNTDAGGIYLRAQFDPSDGLGGMSRSTFKNLEIIDIDGHGLVLEAQNTGGGRTSIDNQFNVFENIQIRRNNPNKNSLLIIGSATENIFIECVFEGDRDMQPTLGANVLLDNVNGRSAGISFINCGFGLAEYGIVMKGAENITLDTCWFENVFTAVQVESCKNINILGCRFANACGYGSEPPNGVFVPNGQCINSKDSSINVERNYVLISNLNKQKAFDANFIFGQRTLVDSITSVNNNTINSRDNHFRDARLSRTIGIVQSLPVTDRKIILDGRKNVAADFDGTRVLRRIESTASGGERIIMRINKPGGNKVIKIKDWEGNGNKGNISLNGQKQLKLTHGQEVTFLKVDSPLSINGEEAIYHLVSVSN
jgi:Pectate lyase superfamily protein